MENLAAGCLGTPHQARRVAGRSGDAALRKLGASWVRGTAHSNFHHLAGTPIPQPIHIYVNGWYFCSLSFLPSSPAGTLWRLLRYALPKALVKPRRVAMTMPFTARFGVELFEREWRTELLPHYQTLVQQSASRVDRLDASGLIRLVDELIDAAGDYFTSITSVAGFAWKAKCHLLISITSISFLVWRQLSAASLWALNSTRFFLPAMPSPASIGSTRPWLSRLLRTVNSPLFPQLR